MPMAPQTARLVLRPFSEQDFDHFVTEMLTYPRFVEFYYSFVDIPNVGSIRVPEKPGFHFEEQIEAYGSDQMYLYRFRPTDAVAH